VDPQRLGQLVRITRHRSGWRQSDLAARCGVSRGLISLVERGFADHVPLYRLRQISQRLDLEIVGYDVRSRTGVVDRLLDEAHAHLVAGAVELLGRFGWEVAPEVSCPRYGERGSFDLLAFHRATSNLLVVEVRSELVSVEATLRKLDEKVRLARFVGHERFEWDAKTVSRLLFLPRSSTSHRQVARHASVIDLVLPGRTAEATAWLRHPVERFGGVIFASNANLARTRRGRACRIRAHRAGRGQPERENGPARAE